MCSGKTSVGSELARRLGWTFTDTDRVIEERAGMTVPEIFSTLGEPAFRRYEFAAVAGALEGSRQVVSLGARRPGERGAQGHDPLPGETRHPGRPA